MEFEQSIEDVANKIRELKDSIKTEEATKTAFIMPFIGQVLAYDIFDPTEVVPEFIADVGLKKGEKVDYALVLDGQVQILIECKKLGASLTKENASQLHRYFNEADARIGVLTNGQVWQFYMDLDKQNIMDERPFMILDLLDIDETLLPQLKKLAKPSFDVESVASAAEKLKYTGAIRREIASEFNEPSDDLVKLLVSRISDVRFTRPVLEKFSPIVAQALRQYLNDQANERLKSALESSDSDQLADVAEAEEEGNEANEDNGIVTTAEELQGYSIIRAIGCSVAEVKRIAMRDAKSYCAILLDDNNRKAIVRLYFNNLKNKRLGIFTPDGEMEMFPIDELSDIYSYSEKIRARIKALCG